MYFNVTKVYLASVKLNQQYQRAITIRDAKPIVIKPKTGKK